VAVGRDLACGVWDDGGVVCGGGPIGIESDFPTLEKLWYADDYANIVSLLEASLDRRGVSGGSAPGERSVEGRVLLVPGGGGSAG
jgi:hypothetical protein